MSEQRHYVKPPKQKRHTTTTTGGKLKASAYLHPDYRKRKLFHLVIVIPVVWMLYGLIISAILFGGIMSNNGFEQSASVSVVFIIQVLLTGISAYFYPFSLYWYRESFVGRLLNGMWYFGGFWSVIGRTIATLIGGVIIAGVLSPIAGPLMLKKCREKDMVIGDAKDFE